MTDAPDPQQELDELASAHLDGLTTAEEAARVASDPALQARVAELARVRTAVAHVAPPVDDPEREAAIAAALDAFDEDRAAAAVVPIARGRRWAPSRALRYAAIAAAVVLAALVVPLLSNLDSGEDDQAATVEETGAAIGDDGAEDLADRAGGEAPTAGSADAFSSLADGDLGAFAEHAELEEAVRARVAAVGSSPAVEAAPTTTVPTGTLEGSCSDRAPGDGVVVLEATATLAGRPVIVVVVDRAEGQTVLSVYDPTSCALLRTSRL